jgi:uncharacterized membrane protein YczE
MEEVKNKNSKQDNSEDNKNKSDRWLREIINLFLILGIGISVYSLYQIGNSLIFENSVTNKGLNPDTFPLSIMTLIFGILMIIIVFLVREEKKYSRGVVGLIFLLILCYKFSNFYSLNSDINSFDGLIFLLLIGCIIYLTFSEEAKKFFNK